MNRTIASTVTQSNTPLSQTAAINNLTPGNQLTNKDVCMPIVTPIKKLNKSTIAVLNVVNYLTQMEWGCCNLRFEAWAAQLKNINAKPLCYRQLKRIFKQLRDLGYIESERINGDRNKRYTHKVTILGKAAYLELSSESMNKSTYTKMSPRKNVPSKVEKCPLEEVKMSPRSLPTPNNINIKKTKKEHDHVNVTLSKPKQEEVKPNSYLLKRLRDSGFYLGPALWALGKKSESEILTAFEISKHAKNPGAVMQDFFKNPDKYKPSTSEATGETKTREFVSFDQSTGFVKARPVDDYNAEYARNVSYNEQMEKYKANRAARGLNNDTV